MWWRNLVFAALVGGGMTALAANLLPPREPRLMQHYDNSHYHSQDFRTVVTAVDGTFERHWVENSIEPASPASDLLLARRIALGLMGTIPSLEELRQFERLPVDQRLDWWLDQVLSDRRSADYLAERFARAVVGKEDGPFIFFRRRRLVSWLSDQFAENRPYDAMVRELIAGAGIWTSQPATNFITVTITPANGNNQPDPVRLAGRVTRAFLGLRIDCAQCHNHPFAEWKQADFQALSAFFAQTRLGFTGIHDGDGEYKAEDHKSKKTRIVLPRVPFEPELLPGDGTRRERLAQWVTDAKNPYFARAAVNRVWALLLGRPLVEPVDDLEAEGVNPPALQLLADDFAAHGYDLHRLIRLIAGTRIFRLDSAADRETTEADERAWAVFPLTRLRPEQVVGSVAQAASVGTINADSHIFVRIIRQTNERDFVKRYGDSGEDEFDGRAGTIPQRLLMMNNPLIQDKIKQNPFVASTRIAWLAPNDRRAVELAYLATLTRRPTIEEAAHFEQSLADPSSPRPQRLEDLYWALLNSTEFTWNH